MPGLCLCTCIFAAMVPNFLFVPHGFLAGYEQYTDFASGDFLPKTVIFTGAMGKTEDTLRVVADNFCNRFRDDALRLFEQVKQQHLTLAKYLLVVNYLEAVQQMQEIFTEVEWLLYDEPVRQSSYYVDQVTGIGPVLNAILVSALLREKKKASAWADARDVLRTDDQFGAANLLEADFLPETAFPFQHDNQLLVMPWTVASTSDNETTRYDGVLLLELINKKAPGAKCQVL